MLSVTYSSWISASIRRMVARNPWGAKAVYRAEPSAMLSSPICVLDSLLIWTERESESLLHKIGGKRDVMRGFGYPTADERPPFPQFRIGAGPVDSPQRP